MDSSSSKRIEIMCEGAERVDWDLLEPFQGDLKKLSIENYDRLKEELLRDGYCEPITVWKKQESVTRSGLGVYRYIILNGHQRIATIREMVEIEKFTVDALPVSIVHVRDENHANDLVLALTSQYGEMTTESLAKFVKERGLRVQTVLERYRFPEVDGKDLIRICSDPQRNPEPENDSGQDEAPPLPNAPRTRRGDIYIMGSHVLLCGDSTDEKEVFRLFAAGGARVNTELADLLFTDPPYNLAEETSLQAVSEVRDSYDRLRNSDWDKGFDVRKIFPVIDRFLAADSSAYICTSHFLAGKVFDGLWEAFDVTHFCVWQKTNPMPSLRKRHWTSSAELIGYATRGKHTFNFPDVGHALNVWSFSKVAKCDVHPTMKPIAVVEHAIAHSSKPGDIVLDLFGGSGTTLIACQKLQRRCRMIEIDPKYCDVIVDRFEILTGQTAELLRAPG